MKNNCYIYETDIFQTRLYDADQTIDMFGEDYLEEYGHYIPEELLTQYKKTFQELQEIQKKLDKYIK